MNMIRASIIWKLRVRRSCMSSHTPYSYVQYVSVCRLTFGVNISGSSVVNIMRSSETMWVDNGWRHIDHLWRTNYEHN